MLSSRRNSSKKCAIQLLLSCAKAIPPRPPNCASCLAPAGVSSFHFLSALIATASPAALPTKECSRELEHRRLVCEPPCHPAGSAKQVLAKRNRPYVLGSTPRTPLSLVQNAPWRDELRLVHGFDG